MKFCTIIGYPLSNPRSVKLWRNFFTKKKLKIKMDPYEIVGVPRSASKSEIESAYRKRARELHPDKNGSTSEFQNLHNAFELIKNAESLEQFMCRDDPISKRIGCDFKGIVEINRMLAISVLLNFPMSESHGPAHNPNIARPVPPAMPDKGPILQKA